MLEIERIEDPGPEVGEAIMATVIAHNERVAGPAHYTGFALVLRDAVGGIIGGLWAEIYYDWCVVRLLALPEEARGRGLGTQMMQQAETIARGRGADGIWLETFSFQARGFYEKLGFTCFGELPEHPRGGARYFMRKSLA